MHRCRPVAIIRKITPKKGSEKMWKATVQDKVKSR